MSKLLLALYSAPLLYCALFALIGAIVGSFIACLVYRLPRILKRHWLADCYAYLNSNHEPLASSSPKDSTEAQNRPETPETEPVLSLYSPRSHCPSCKQSLSFFDNLPLISFLWLRGRCRYCQVRIDPIYFIIELLCTLITPLTAYCLGPNIPMLFGLLCTWWLLSIGLIDLQTQLIPDQLSLPLLWLGLILNTLFGCFAPIETAVLGAALGYAVLWTLYWIFKYLTQQEGLGFGDFKLLAALGAWFGWHALPKLILFSALPAIAIHSLLFWVQKKSFKTRIAYGTYLALAGWIFLIVTYSSSMRNNLA